MKALGPIPPGFEADAEGRLLIGGRDVEALVGEAGGTPLFVYDSRAGSPIRWRDSGLHSRPKSRCIMP